MNGAAQCGVREDVADRRKIRAADHSTATGGNKRNRPGGDNRCGDVVMVAAVQLGVVARDVCVTRREAGLPGRNRGNPRRARCGR